MNSMDPLKEYLESVEVDQGQVGQEPSRTNISQSSVRTADSDIFCSSRDSRSGSGAVPSRPQSHGPTSKLESMSGHPPPSGPLSPVAPTGRARAYSAKSDASYGIKAKLPPIDSEYQAHQRLIPRTTGPSNYIKRHNLSHGVPAGSLPRENTGRATSPRNGSIRLASLNGPEGQLSARSMGEDPSKYHWSCSSVGDLEALDSILDQLVVLDVGMKEALMNGPLISFETVVPEPRAADMYGVHMEDLKDYTFLTSVKEAMPGHLHQEEACDAGEHPDGVEMTPELERIHSPLPPPGLDGGANVEWHLGGAQGGGVIHEGDEVAALRATMPVPILPKLARMYINNKQAQLSKAPPPAPPTADYLLRSRPGNNLAAPSYNSLCQQIRDVQRQYTCGTIREASDHSAPRNNIDMYISGLDGPSLEDVVMHEDLPIGLEHSRPSFVAMKRNMASARKQKWSSSTFR